jgi:hypothetical protein
VDKCYVRKSFYLTPPTMNAPEAEWQDWLKKDNRAAQTAKAKHTRSLKGSSETNIDYSTRKVQGVWKSVPILGFVGEGDQNGHVEPVFEATQEVSIDKAREFLLHAKGGRTKAAKERREAKRAKRRQGFRK